MIPGQVLVSSLGRVEDLRQSTHVGALSAVTVFFGGWSLTIALAFIAKIEGAREEDGSASKGEVAISGTLVRARLQGGRGSGW